ncbi:MULTISPECIES: VWA domain-containing protein [unclassified Streptomyces]|uniref:VWA domain-containing protein n=1 Tax=unclassified Streptomyces TaxID=2593676 RepID=UPI0036BDBC8C
MGIRSLLRKVFGRDRDHEETTAPSVPPQTREPAAVTAPAEERVTEPVAPGAGPAPQPPEEAARRSADDLVAAAFDNPQIPKARTVDGETQESAEPAATQPEPEGEAGVPGPRQEERPEEPEAAEEPLETTAAAETDTTAKDGTPAGDEAPAPAAAEEPQAEADVPAEAAPQAQEEERERAEEKAEAEERQPEAPEATEDTEAAEEPSAPEEPAAAEERQPEAPEAAEDTGAAEEPSAPEEPAAAEERQPEAPEAAEDTGAAEEQAPASSEAGDDAPAAAPREAGPAMTLAKVKAAAPHLTDAYKAAGGVLRKQGLAGARTRVYLVVDRSGSMRGYFKDGSVQRLAEQAVALAAHLDEEATVTAVFFSTDVDGTVELTPATTSPTRVEEINGTLGRLGRTNYHRAVEEVLAHHGKTDPAAPALVIFQTDGAPESKTAATEALAAAADRPLHWRFVAWGEEDNKAFDYLRKLESPRTATYFAGPEPSATAHTTFYRKLLADLTEL